MDKPNHMQEEGPFKAYNQTRVGSLIDEKKKKSAVKIVGIFLSPEIYFLDGFLSLFPRGRERVGVVVGNGETFICLLKTQEATMDKSQHLCNLRCDYVDGLKKKIFYIFI